MYIIKSVSPLFDPEKELYESHVGLDDQKKTLLLSCWGVTEAQSNQLAQGMVKKLEAYIEETHTAITKQKYKKGDRVKVLVGHPVWTISGKDKGTAADIRSELAKDIATVEYTYGQMSEIDERFSKGEQGYKDYCLNFDKYGSISWFHEDNIVLVEAAPNQELRKNPLTIEECITPAQFFIGELEKLVRSAQDCGNTQLEAILQRLVGVVAAGDELFYLMETKGVTEMLMQRIKQQQIDNKTKLN